MLGPHIDHPSVIDSDHYVVIWSVAPRDVSQHHLVAGVTAHESVGVGILRSRPTSGMCEALTVVDTFPRYSPVVDPRLSDRADEAVMALQPTCVVTACPNRSAFTRARNLSAGS